MVGSLLWICNLDVEKCTNIFFKKSSRFKCFTHQISKVSPSQDSKKWPVWPLVNILVWFDAYNQKVFMSPFAGYCLPFFCISYSFAVIIFKYFSFFRRHCIESATRYDKQTAYPVDDYFFFFYM